MLPRLTFAVSIIACLAATACKPPATDDYVARTAIGGKNKGPSEPILSPDVEGAVWAQAPKPDRILYGKPGATPLMAMECREAQSGPEIAFTRFAHADEGAKAILALIGNGHVERFFVDAAPVGSNGASLWYGRVAASDNRLGVLTGGRDVEATVPGAGSVKLHASALTGQLVNACRAKSGPQPDLTPLPSAEPAATPSPPAMPG